MRLLNFGKRMRMRRGTHTGFIGEESALDALADGHLKCVADTSADDRIRHKCIFKDHAYGSGQEFDPCNENDQTADQIQAGHDGNDLFRH